MPASEKALPVYSCATIVGGKSDIFYYPTSRVILANQLVKVINIEGPIVDALLFRRVARSWGLARTGRRIEELLRSLLSSKIVRTTEGETNFYWPDSLSPAQWQEFRVADSSDDSKRQLGEICLEELANMAIFILSEHGATSVSELARTICRLQGIARTTTEAEARILMALQAGRAKEFVCLAGGVVRLLKS